MELLTKLKVMVDNSLVDHSEAGTGKDKNDLNIYNSGTRRSKGPKASKMSKLEKEFAPTFKHALDVSNDTYRKTDNLSSNKHEWLHSNGSRQGTTNNIAWCGVGGGYNECDEEDSFGLDLIGDQAMTSFLQRWNHGIQNVIQPIPMKKLLRCSCQQEALVMGVTSELVFTTAPSDIYVINNEFRFSEKMCVLYVMWVRALRIFEDMVSLDRKVFASNRLI